MFVETHFTQCKIVANQRVTYNIEVLHCSVRFTVNTIARFLVFEFDYLQYYTNRPLGTSMRPCPMWSACFRARLRRRQLLQAVDASKLVVGVAEALVCA